jgi:hypothetical protein
MSESIDINRIVINDSSIQKRSKPCNYLFSNEKETINKEEEDNKLKLVEVISESLKDICDKNESETRNLNLNIQKPFTTKATPDISIKDYLERLTKFTKMEESTLILTLIYIDRIGNYTNFQLTYKNIYKLILASVFVAIKFNEDSHYSIDTYAKIGRVSRSELAYLEFHFLIIINFDLNVDKHLFNQYSESLKSFQDDYSEEIEEIEDDDEKEEENKK